MIIVSGWIRVDAAARTAYLDGCLELIAQARVAPGCLDFHLSECTDRRACLSA